MKSLQSNNNLHMALSSIGSAKWRSFLTMLGVIIGVMSVVTIVSLGEGVKHQLSSQIKHTGKDLITVRGGVVADYDTNGNVDKVNLLSLFASSAMSDVDYQTVLKVPDLKIVAPFALVTGVPKADDGTIGKQIHIVATNHQGAQALNQKVDYGGYFNNPDHQGPVAVIGPKVAEILFKENVPVGKNFELRGRKFSVLGVFERFEPSPLTPGVDYNNSIFIPYEYAKQITETPIQPYQIMARPSEGVSVALSAQKIRDALTATHSGQTDFTVLMSDTTLAVANNVLSMLTNVVSAVAAISLLVGGIGIMNIMLVSVSERTYEIGIRKSVGATNKQILSQFLTEAVVLSGLGGIFGIIMSLVVNYLLRVFTSMQPVITIPIMIYAVIVALLVGVIFGITPALKAARKDPINALKRV